MMSLGGSYNAVLADVPYAPSLAVSASYMFAGPNATEWFRAGCARAGGGREMCWQTRDLLGLVWTSGVRVIRPS